MAEYIERESLKNAFWSACQNCLSEDDVADLIEAAPSADVVPVVLGRWVHTKKHLWYKDEDGNVDVWRVDVGFCNGPQCRVCGESFCMHCNPNWADEECEVGHYLCSECGETSKDAQQNYCPNCGAKMDLEE